MVFMVFTGLFNCFALRINLSVAVVAMTENKTIQNDDGSKSYHQEFEWDSMQKALVLSSFFYGYIVTQIFGGILAQKIGGFLPFGVAVGASSILNLIIPAAAKLSVYFLVAVKVLDGLFEGISFASVFNLWSKWAPPLERSRMVMTSSIGIQLGLVVASSLSGVLASEVNWESIFYVFGGLGCIWTVMWLIFVRSSPATDRFITHEERKFIESQLNTESKASNNKIPWKSILTSSAVWAIVIAHFAESWGSFTLHTQLPIFLNDVFDYNVKQSGIFSSLPYLAICFTMLLAGFLADYVQTSGILTRRNARRTFTCSAFIGQAVLRISAVYFMNPITTVILITLSASLNAFAYSGFSVNYLEVAPQFSGIIVAISNFISCFAGILCTLLSGFIVTEKVS
jgi:MFS transporter, ACS family, solute carrier family 17 (sodium-dependent inorganic phosphate cotransporter), other